MLVLGLLVLAAAVVVGSVGVASNTGTAHQLPDGFSLFGYHIHGSVGKLFFAGLIIGAVGMIGLVMVIDGLRRSAALRRELLRFRREARARSRRTAPQAPSAPAPIAPAPVTQTTAPVATPAPRTASAGQGGGTTSVGTSLRRGLRSLSTIRPSKPAADEPAEDRNVTSAS